jgi:hypothetical protein
LDSLHWYYGLDTNSGTTGVNLVTVLIHEFAHGLGFQTFTSASTGVQLSGFPSIYDRFLFDNTKNKTWPEMTDAERQASAINTSNLIWRGPQVTSDVPAVLAGTPRLRVNSPAGIAGKYQTGVAQFGPALTPAGLTAAVVLAQGDAGATDGCSVLTNVAAVSGKIALIDRGTCTFTAKVKNAQNAGAIGVIIANNGSGGPPAMPGTDPTITIPAISITQADGIKIKGQFGAGVNATLILDSAAATIYAPNPFEGGSSVSHWDTSLTPNQLMEPNISSDLTFSVGAPQDLTSSLLKDIGWLVSKTDQTITFPPLVDKTFGDAPFSVSATASSGLPVSFSIVSGPATISGNMVTITGPGTITVRASQGGNGNFNAAPTVDRSFVAKSNQTITFNALANKVFGDAPFAVSATSSSGLPVSFSIVSGPATISVNIITITGTGPVTVRASQAGNSNFNSALSVDQTFTVAKANQTITFNSLSGKTFGDTPFPINANASSGLPVSFTILSGPASIFSNTITITGAGTVTVRSSQAGNANYFAATVVDQSFIVSKANQTITFNALANKIFGDAPFDVNANSSSGLPVSLSIVSGPAAISGNTITLSAVGVVTVRASQAGNVNYNAATSVDRSFTAEAGTFQSSALTSDQTAIKTWTFQGTTYIYLKLSFPNAGYRVANWGSATRAGNDFTADAAVEKFTGASVQAVTTTAQIYDLGPLANGTYNFNFKTSGILARTLQFTISSTVPPPNPIDDARQFVKQQYRDFLNREADQAGEDFWTDNIAKCNDPARRPPGQTVEQCTLRQRETTSGAFFLSPEFQYTGYFVYRVYQGGLGRQPKLSEFLLDAQFVGNGIVVNGQLSGAVINQNKAAFAALFVNCTDATKYRCAEFKAIYDPLNNQQYVDKLFLTTGVNASATDRTALVNGLNGGTETRATVLQKVVDGINVISEGNQQFTTTYGQAFYNSEFNRAFVELEYFGYMKRDPDDAGYAFWLGKLNQFGGNFVNAEMVLAFISSPEYRAQFGQP